MVPTLLWPSLGRCSWLYHVLTLPSNCCVRSPSDCFFLCGHWNAQLCDGGDSQADLLCCYDMCCDLGGAAAVLAVDGSWSFGVRLSNKELLSAAVIVIIFA